MTNHDIKKAAFAGQNEVLLYAVNRRSIALVITKDGAYCHQGSGVCISMCGRYFIATAGHVLKIDEKPVRLEQIRLATPGRQGSLSVPELKVDILSNAVNFGISNLFDLGWIEISSETAIALDLEYVSLEKILFGFSSDISNNLFVYGYPGEWRDDEAAKSNILKTLALGYSTVPIAWSRWHEFDTVDSKKRIDTHIIADYPQDGNFYTKKIDKNAQLPNPRGVSGGGIWLINQNHKGIWSFGNVRLVGIEYAWIPQKRAVFGTQIQHWFQLLLSDIPALVANCPSSKKV